MYQISRTYKMDSQFPRGPKRTNWQKATLEGAWPWEGIEASARKS